MSVLACLGTVISNAGSPVGPCPSLASVVMIKQHDQKQLKKQFISAFDFIGIRAYHGREAW